MDKIKKIVNCVVPVTMCNLKCHYCYIGQTNSFDKNIPKLEYSVDHMVSALTKDRLGGACMMNLCAVGETLMAPYLFDLSKGLINNGHYVTIVTNGILTDKIKKFCEMDESQKKNLFFKFSYQFLELKRLNLIEKFFDNIKMVRDSNISFSVELTANDESIPYIDELKKYCNDALGADPHIIESRDNNHAFKKLTKLPNEEHMKSWSKIDTPLITFQDREWDKKRCEFCYAGKWVATLYLQNGNLAPCFGGGPIFQNVFEDIETPIHWCEIGHKCPWEHCYAAYVLLTLGAIPELDTPHYDEVRNRVTKNGEWLQENMKHFMHSKLVESNDELNDDKKNIIDWYQSINLNSPLNNDEKDKVATSLNKILSEKNIRSVGVLSFDKYSNSLIKLLDSKKVKYILSLNYEENNKNLKSAFIHLNKYRLKKILRKHEIPVLNHYDKLPKTDIIIVTDILNFEKLKKQVPCKIAKKMVLITEL